MIAVQIFIAWLFTTAVINAYLMTLPKLDLKKTDFPVKHQIISNNRIDMQKNHECAAFSTAYLLRHFDIDAEGLELYNDFPNKMRSGCVYPKGIRTYLKEKGFKTSYYKGNINSLKRKISEGNPVIVFIKVNKAGNNLHYVPVTGYDEKYFYVAESLENLVNCTKGNVYNRRISIQEFKKLWDIKSLRMPFYSNTYITIEK